MIKQCIHLLFSILAMVGLCQSALAQDANPKVKVETDAGAFVIELYPAKAPKSVANFLQYVDAGFYDNTVFHRVIPGFVVQGGGMTADMQQKPTRAPIENEAKNGLKNETATLSMARTQDPNSASSQFFINLRHNDSLDYPSFDGWGYAVFGKVVDGMATIRKIEAAKTGTVAGHRDVPVKPITLLSARRVVPTAAK
ncbi:peptidylprolyl isomerase [Niveibacterium sp. 24ML]|nr:peptidylprolyl isomerase [Niveibacterium sp. 24ML]MCX9155147.1 peptidylprolyl isomerase [Niveibacterium sp. 24ML]